MKRKLLVLLFTLASALCLSLGLAGCDFGSGAHTHSYTESVVAPTCTEQGYTLHTCSCGDSYTDTYTAALGHDYEDGYCTVCGARAPSEGLALTLSSGGTYYTVTGIGTCTDTDVVIPSEYKGLPVTAIGAQAFDNNTDLTGITIPDSVTSIGDYAFENCTGLESITVERGNTVYHSAGNCLIETESKTLILGCKNSVIPSDGSVTSIGSYAFYKCTSLTSVTIPDSVTYIGRSAFQNCTGLMSVTLGSGVTEIGVSAFSGCTSLTRITIPDSITKIYSGAFDNCNLSYNMYNNAYYLGNDSNPYLVLVKATSTSITSCTVHENTKVIYYEAFYGCTGLTSITIPDGVTYIGWSAFERCTSLTSITIPDSVTSIDSCAFYGCTSLTGVYISDIVAWCGITFGNTSANPLYYAGNLYLNGVLVTELVIPDGVTKIGNYAFAYCTGLTSITIPDSVETIGDGAFRACSSLTSITIPDSVTSIGEYAFYYCTDLTSVTIGSGVTSIGENAFKNCTSLTGVYIEDITAWCGITFGSDSANPLYYAGNLYWNGVLVTELVIPDGVTSIGYCAFYKCTSLTSITIPDSVETIGEYAFSGCSNLDYNEYENAYYLGNDSNPYVVLVSAMSTDITSCTIHKDTKFIHSNAFYGCTSLTSITIPDSVTSIGIYAFYHCTSLESVTIGSNVTEIGINAFRYCTSLTGVYITDIAAWCGITFSNDDANPLCYAGNLYLNGELVTELVIPNSVTSIGSYAFYYCTSLTSITIPDSVTSIGDEAFYKCTSLTTVYYGGSAEDWDEITIGYDNSPLTDATVYYYSESEPTAEGNY